MNKKSLPFLGIKLVNGDQNVRIDPAAYFVDGIAISKAKYCLYLRSLEGNTLNYPKKYSKKEIDGARLIW